MKDIEYKVLPLDKLQPFLIRQLRPGVVNSLKERLTQGFNPARPLTIVKKDGIYIVADGNHRLAALHELGVKEVPVIIREGDPYWLAIQGNQDEDTYAPMDLFDWLDVIKSLKAEGLTQERIGERIGWSREKVRDYSTLHDKVGANILDLCREHQQGRATDNGATAPLDFTEGWFRTSGIYGLDESYQLKIIQEVIEGKLPTKQKVTAQAERYAWHQQLKKYALEHLAAETSPDDRELLLKHIDEDVYGSKPDKEGKLLEKLDKSISALNERALGVRLFHDDAFQRIPLLKDQSVALVITDPPYNVTDEEWDKFSSPEAYLDWIGKWLKALKPKMADQYHLFIFCAPAYMSRIEQLLVNQGWPIKSRIIWSYRNLVMGRDVADKFISSWQPVFHCGTHSLNWSPEWNDERLDVQVYATPQSNFKDAKLHPDSKPTKLIELFVRVGSKPGDIVLDPFAGGGVTGEACTNIKQRKCLLIEREDKYIRIIEQRLNIKTVKDNSDE